MPEAAPLISTRELRVRFGGVEALKGVDVELYPGEIHAVVGENGAGKSTFARVLAGVHRPSAGQIRLGGEPVRFRNPAAAAAAGVALVPQEPLTCGELSAAENVYLGARPSTRFGTVDWKAMNSGAAAAFERLGQNLDPRAPAGALSIAGRQMLEVAGALVREARVVLLDETTASLSPKEVDELFAVMAKLRAEGKALGFINHRLEEVFAICDRVTVLRDGEKVAEMRIADTSVPEVVRLMVGRDVEPSRGAAAARPGPPRLEVRNLELRSRVRGASFSVAAGEIVVLAGLVGSGRTEIAHALFGVEPPRSGTILLDGTPVRPRSPREAMRLGVALVPEDRLRHGLLMPESIAGNIALPVLGRLGRPWTRPAKERRIAEGWIARFAVACRGPAQPVQDLSGGNQQKATLAKWLQTEPKLLIVDEPTRGVDVGAKAQVHSILRELAAGGMAILAVSSDLPEALAIADRVLVMREGRPAAEFSAAEASEEAIMFAATGGRPAGA